MATFLMPKHIRCAFTVLIISLLLDLKQLSCDPLLDDPDNSDLELRLVQIVARHGIRAPEFPYPTDPFKDEAKYWPNGWGQLTELGKQRQYQLGQFIRRRYDNFLSPNYSEKEIYVLSSDFDRTILSAQLAMVGLYPNVNAAAASTENMLIHASVPVRTIPKTTDKMIQPHQQCPRLKIIRNETEITNPEVLEHRRRNKKLFQDLADNMGYSDPQAPAIYNSVGSLVIENMYNLSIPAWARDILANETAMIQFYWGFKQFTITPEQKRLVAGPILTELTNNMKNKIRGNETRKLFFYSGHDIIQANILNTLGIFELHWPEPSSCLIFELYFRNSSREYELQIRYKYNSTSDDLRVLTLPNCTETWRRISMNETECKFETFLELVQPYIIENLEHECAIKSIVEEYIGITVLDAILIGVIVLVVLIFLATQIYQCSRSKADKYSP